MTGRSTPVAAGLEHRLRKDALAIFRAALASVDPEVLVRAALAGDPRLLPPAGGRLVVVSVGKAAVPMARGAWAALGESIAEGVLLAPLGGGGSAPDGFREHRGGHPLPDQAGMAGARDVLDTVRRAGRLDRVLLLLSGGGSALLTLPHPSVSLPELREVTERLLRAGASIGELNAVRKHLERLKGGRLAALAEPAPLTALVLSDVVGDPLDVIASGPVSPDSSTFGEAIEVLRNRGLWEAAPPLVREHLTRGREGRAPETPKDGDAAFAGVQVKVVGNAALAARRAAEEAERLGYPSRVRSTGVTGEARDVGAFLAAEVRGLLRSGNVPACVVTAGETTVTVRGNGRGGRNQELALSAALHLDGEAGALVLSAGTDGVDGPTDAAGAIATGTTLHRARSLGLDPEDHLARNDAHPFFDALGDLVRTGPTGTNVMDLMLALAADPDPPAVSDP